MAGTDGVERAEVVLAEADDRSSPPEPFSGEFPPPEVDNGKPPPPTCEIVREVFGRKDNDDIFDNGREDNPPSIEGGGGGCCCCCCCWEGGV